MTRLGIIGVGHLAEQLVAGWMRDPERRPEILLSPRNAGKAAKLSRDYGLNTAVSNSAVVENSDIVILASRPAQAAEAVAGLPWRKDQHLVSVCAGVTLEDLKAASPAACHRAMPLTASRIGESPTLLFPDSPALHDALQPLGPVIAVPDERSFDLATVNAAVYGWVFALISEITDYTISEGLDPAVARHITTHSFRAATGMILKHPGQPISEMIADLATPGGITELGLSHLTSEDALKCWSRASEKVVQRLLRRD
ncbi:MAG: NAD(P)-binding domain-containing protein [Rhodospirillales bacterium]